MLGAPACGRDGDVVEQSAEGLPASVTPMPAAGRAAVGGAPGGRRAGRERAQPRRFASSLGQTAEAASATLSGVGLATDGVAMVLPIAASELWRQRRYLTAAGARAIWLMALSMTLLYGFTSTRIGDAVAGRSKTADQGRRADRAAAPACAPNAHRRTRPGSVATLDAERQATRGPLWRPTAGCTDATRPESARTCEPMQARARPSGETRGKIIEFERKVGALPAVVATLMRR
jgi:hypothetical protein